MATIKVTPELEAELSALAAASGCELVHCEFKGGLLRLFIDRPEGVTLDDCELVARQASALLDVLDFGGSRYTLEVSSPGLDRQLYGLRDYEKFVGRLVRLTYRPEDGSSRRTIVGRLEGLNAGDPDPLVVVREDPRQEALVVPFGRVVVARLEIEL
ncbi:MAG: ribosome maturation factor RimP [Holophagales bacterium]|nr:MAG: ribosome maturation factor RimP [Holophagales bacterium]